MNPTCIEDMFKYVLLPDPLDPKEQYMFFKDGDRILYRYTTKDGRKYQEYYYSPPSSLFDIVKRWTILRPISEVAAYNPVHEKIAELSERFAKRKKVSTTHKGPTPRYAVQYNSW